MKSTDNQQLNPQVQKILDDYFSLLFRTIITAATETNNIKLGLAAFKELNADAVAPDLEITEQEITEFSGNAIWLDVHEAIQFIQEPSLLNLKSHNNGIEPDTAVVQLYIESLIKTACNDFDSGCSKEKSRIKNKKNEEEERKRKHAEWEQGVIDKGLPSLEFFVYGNKLIPIQEIVEKEKRRYGSNWYTSNSGLVFAAIKKAEELGHQQIVKYFLDDANLKEAYTTTLEKERLQMLEDRIAEGLSSLTFFVKQNNLPAIQRVVEAEKTKSGAQWYSHKYYEIQDAIKVAFINNHSYIIKYLLQEGILADSYIEDKNEHLFDFLVYAAEYDNDEVIAFLESLRPNIQPPLFPKTEHPHTQEETAHRQQIQNDYYKQQMRMDRNWDTAFRRAIRSTKLKVAEYYLTQGKRNAESGCVLTKIAEGSYASFNNLAIAILNQNTAMIELLLKHGASIVRAREQLFDAYKEKKLSYAFYKGITLPDELTIYQKAIKLLLDYSVGHHLNGSSLGDTSMNLEFLAGLNISHFNFIGISIFENGRPRLIEPRDLVKFKGHETAFYTPEDSLVLLQSAYSRMQGYHDNEENEERYKRIQKKVDSISLDRAIRTGNLPTFMQRLGEGIDLNTLEPHPLQLATQYGQLEITKILLELGFVNEDVLNKALKSLAFYERYPDLTLLLATHKKQAGLEEAPQPASASLLGFFANTDSDLPAPLGNTRSSLTNQKPL